MKDGKTLTFIGLFDEVGRIEIPIIQRDYAQGRKEAVEVRNQFLDAIRNVLLLSCDDLKQPLDLDFVYGNFEGTNNDIFSVLDGQQRLTTLYLLHWYLAIKDGHIDEFREKFVIDGISRFTYKTRPSTTEFFDALVNSKMDSESLHSSKCLSTQLQDSQWFFLSWKQDPTVQSSLRMIDSIHNYFGGIDEDQYVRLTDNLVPYVTFQYLNLESFGLSDELYIKMNARGKALTDFENFKAWLFGRIQKFKISGRFEKRVDQEWTDIFWRMSLQGKDQFDELYLKFFNLMAFYAFCERVEGSYSSLDVSVRAWLRSIRLATGHMSHNRFEEFDLFSLDDALCIEAVLEYMHQCDDSEHKGLFQSVLKGSDYVTQARFYALMLFLKKSSPILEWNDSIKEHLNRWIRVTNNLIYNFRIDELAPFIPTIRALNDLSGKCFELYEYISEDDTEVSGFTNSQWREERVKAGLILTDKRWEPIFNDLESHSYLKGKVGFVLDMIEKDSNYSIDDFLMCAKKVEFLLSDEILRSNEFLLQRALLTIGDYLISVGSSRYSFGLHNRGTYRERADNWLSVVEKGEFKVLVSNIAGDFFESIRSIISSVDCGGWRELIVRNPEVIRYCENRLIHKQNEQIYLLTKSSFRGYHSELRTFVLERRLRDKFRDISLPDGINSFEYDPVYGDSFPCIIFEIENNRNIRVVYNNGGYIAEEFLIKGDDPDSGAIEKIEFPVKLRSLLSE